MKKMDRVFQSKVDFSSYLLLAFALTATVWAMWNKTGLIYAPCIVLVALIVERIIHTQYVVTADGHLVIQRGRLSKDKTLSIQSIARIDQVARFHIGRKSFGQYLIVVMSGGEQVAIRPKYESAFVEHITKRRNQMDQAAPKHIDPSNDASTTYSSDDLTTTIDAETDEE